MIGAFLNKPGSIELKQVEKPEPGLGELRIKLTHTGICGSDIHLFLGHRLLHKPTILGHEGLGVVDKTGEGVTGRTIGERVVVEPNIPCWKCHLCRSGRGNICENKRIVGQSEAGCFAEYVVVPAEFAWKVPEDMTSEDAVAIEPMAVAVHALFTSNAKPGDTIAIIGLGAIGLLLNHLALALGYQVFVTEINEEKVKIATAMGATAVDAGDLSESWLANDVSAVFECAGAAQTASLATANAPRGADIVLVGLSGDLASFQPLKIAREGIRIVPSLIYDHPFDFKRTLQLVQAKVIHPGFVISGYEPLENLQTALERAAQGNESKIIIHI